MSVTNPYWSRAPLICFSVAVAAFSFWSALMLLDQSGAPSSTSDPVVTALPSGTPLTSLAELPALPDPRFSWLGISGMNVQVIAGVPPVTGQPILRLVALQDGVLQAWNASYRRLRMILPGHPDKTEHDWEDVKKRLHAALAAIK
jgi:hypothetical protein